MEWYIGKKVFITGGSSGIGKATAEHLVRWGADVCIASQGIERLNEAAEEIRRHAVRPGQKILAMPLDVTAPKKCQIIAQKAAPRGKFIIIPGFMSKRTYALNRCAPFLLRGILDRELRNYQKKAFGSEKTIPELKTEFTV